MTPHDLDPRRPDLPARLRRLGASDDATDGPFADLTAALTARVRRRRRRRTAGASAAVASVVAAALVLVPGSPAALLDRSEPQPATTTGIGVDGLCGLALAPGYSAPGSAPIDIVVAGERSTVTADETWSADVSHVAAPDRDDASHGAASGPDDTELVLVAADGPDEGRVVGVGQVPLAQGAPVAAAADPGSATHYATGFVGCDGGPVPAGQYRAVVADLVGPARAAAKDLTGLKGVERTSPAYPLTVRTPKTTPEGATRPAWLAGTSLWCGMSESDLFRAMPDPTDAAVTTGPSPVGPSAVAGGTKPGIRLRNPGPQDVTVTVGKNPVLAWIDPSTTKVVAFGRDELATTRTLTIPSGGAIDYRTTGYDPTDSCAASHGDSAAAPIPPGLYELVVYTRVPQGARDGSAAFLSTSGPEVRVQNDGAVTTDLSEQTDTTAAALALTKHGHQPAWLRGSGLTCGMTESAYEGQSWPDVPVAFSGFFKPDGGRTGTVLALTPRTTGASGAAPITTPGQVGVAWFTTASDGQPFKLVSFGADPGPGRAVTVGKDGVTRHGSLDTPDSCAPDAHGAYSQHLPAGDYWVALYTSVTTADGQHAWLTDSGEMGVTLDADGLVGGR